MIASETMANSSRPVTVSQRGSLSLECPSEKRTTFGTAVRFLSMVMICALAALSHPARAQDNYVRLNENATCFSCQMKAGSQQIPLLTSPEKFERERTLFDRSIGGISGSSSQTQEATREQIVRPESTKSAGIQPVTFEPAFTDQVSEESFSGNRLPSLRPFQYQFNQVDNSRMNDSSSLTTPEIGGSVWLLNGRGRNRGQLLNNKFFSGDQE